MKIFRIIIGVLMIIPVYMFVFWLIIDPPYDYAIHGDREILFLIFGLPIIMVNYVAWFMPHIIERIIADFNDKSS